MDPLEHVKRKYVQKPYSFWINRIGQDPIVEQGLENGTSEIDVSAVWEREPDGPILVLISQSSHKLWRINMPTVSFVVHPPGTA